MLIASQGCFIPLEKKIRYPLHRRLGEPQSQPGLESRTVQPVASSLQGLRYHVSIPTRSRMINLFARLDGCDASIFRINEFASAE